MPLFALLLLCVMFLTVHHSQCKRSSLRVQCKDYTHFATNHIGFTCAFANASTRTLILSFLTCVCSFCHHKFQEKIELVLCDSLDFQGFDSQLKFVCVWSTIAQFICDLISGNICVFVCHSLGASGCQNARVAASPMTIPPPPPHPLPSHSLPSARTEAQ